MSFDSIESVAEELVLFTDNDGVINRQNAVPIVANLVRHMARGDYSHQGAVKAFSYLAEVGAKKYCQEMGSPGQTWHSMFPVEARKLAAESWAAEFEQRYDGGEYDHLKPKKYQQPASSRPKRPGSRSFSKGGQYDGSEEAKKHANEHEYVCGGKFPKGLYPNASRQFQIGYVHQMGDIVAQNVASNLSEDDVRAIVRKVGFPEIVYPGAEAQFKAAYMHRMRKILDAVEGN